MSEEIILVVNGKSHTIRAAEDTLFLYIQRMSWDSRVRNLVAAGGFTVREVNVGTRRCRVLGHSNAVPQPHGKLYEIQP